MTNEEIAKLLHETYEKLASEHDYETRPESAVPWEEVPRNNQALMMATVAEIRPALEAGMQRVWPPMEPKQGVFETEFKFALYTIKGGGRHYRPLAYNAEGKEVAFSRKRHGWLALIDYIYSIAKEHGWGDLEALMQKPLRFRAQHWRQSDKHDWKLDYHLISLEGKPIISELGYPSSFKTQEEVVAFADSLGLTAEFVEVPDGKDGH